MMRNGNTYQLITDHLGSVRLVVDINTGDIAQKIDYDEFGNIIYDSNPGFQPFGYAYGLYGMQTKLVKFGTRDYDANVGRWTCKDPIGFGGKSINLFNYCNSNPVNLIDINGLKITFVGANTDLLHIYATQMQRTPLGASLYALADLYDVKIQFGNTSSNSKEDAEINSYLDTDCSGNQVVKSVIIFSTNNPTKNGIGTLAHELTHVLQAHSEPFDKFVNDIWMQNLLLPYGLQPFETEAIVNANIVTDEYQYVGTYDPIEVTPQ